MLDPSAGAQHLSFSHILEGHEHPGGQQKVPALIRRIG